MSLGENEELVRLLISGAILSGSLCCLITGLFWNIEYKKRKHFKS